MSNSEDRQTTQVITAEKAALAAMREQANELGVEGVSGVISVALILELAAISDEEYQALIGLTLFELIQKMTNDETSFAMFPVLNDIVGKMSRQPDPKNRGEADRGTNYGAYGGGKLWYSLRIGENSGGKGVRRGESPARGAIIRNNIATTFSGGTPDEDHQISNRGIETYEAITEIDWNIFERLTDVKALDKVIAKRNQDKRVEIGPNPLPTDLPHWVDLKNGESYSLYITEQGALFRNSKPAWV